MNKITMQTLPGAGRYVGNVSYFIHDPDETSLVVDQIFYQERATTPEGQTASSSKGLTIEVCNGGNINGLARRFSDKLAADGYTVTEPTTYDGKQMEKTRIQVKEAGTGSDLVSYFANAAVETAPDELPTGVDIRIILGTGES